MHDDLNSTPMAALAEAVLETVPAHIAVLDRQGVIQAVNPAWRRFALENAPTPGAVPPGCDVGANYLAACDAAQGAASEGAAEAAAGIRAVLSGQRWEFRLEYPCHSPESRRWFLMWVTPVARPESGAVVVHVDITARKLVEMEARENALRLELALEASGDGLWDWDLRTNQAYLSPGYYAMTGYRPEEVTADFDFFRSLVNPEDWPQVEATMQAHLRGETPESRVEYRMLTRTGEARWIQGRGRVTERDGAGHPLRMMGLITDITEKKRAELEQMRLRARSETILQSHVIGLVRVEQRIIQEANRAMHAMFGYADGELIGQPTRRLFPDDESHMRFGAVLYPLLQAGEAYHGTLHLQRRDGSLGWYRVDISPLGAIGGASVAAMMDVTQEKILEDRLRVSEARYRAVLEDQTEVISRFDHAGRFLFVNEVYCRFFGKTADELLGRSWQPDAHPDDIEMIEARLAELEPDRPVVTIENRVYDAQGVMRWMQFVNRAFFSADGRIREIQSVGRDITERKAVEARETLLRKEVTRLGRELIRLQEKERASLAGELHDELSQELVAIRARAAALRHRLAAGESRSLDDVDAIEESARRIYATSHRIMEGLRPQVLDSAGLDDALRGLVAAWSARHPGVRVRLRLPAWQSALSGEVRIQLFRIAQECLANVAGHARAGRVRLFLGPGRHAGADAVRLVVRDDGIGLDPEAPHAGLGLILMRERTHSLGGRIDLCSRPGAGTRVAVSVPL